MAKIHTRAKRKLRMQTSRGRNRKPRLKTFKREETAKKYAESKGVVLLLEPVNRYETNLINTLNDGLDIIEEIGSDHLKLLPDTFHMNIEESSIEESIVRAGSSIGYIHFADSNRLAYKLQQTCSS